LLVGRHSDRARGGGADRFSTKSDCVVTRERKKRNRLNVLSQFVCKVVFDYITTNRWILLACVLLKITGIELIIIV
jgi:hypothetical protein